MTEDKPQDGPAVAGDLFELIPSRMNVTDAGKKGGETTRERHGADHYREAGRKGGNTLKAERGLDYYREIGRKGGLANKRNHDDAYHSERGRAAGAATRDKMTAAEPEFYARIGRIGGKAKSSKGRRDG